MKATEKKQPYQLAVRFIDGTDEVLFRVMKKLGTDPKKDRAKIIRWALLNFDREILFRELDQNGLYRDYADVRRLIEKDASASGASPGEEHDSTHPLPGFAKTARSGSR